jgi:hypothetical protein
LSHLLSQVAEVGELRERIGRLEAESATFREQTTAVAARLREAEAARDAARAELAY